MVNDGDERTVILSQHWNRLEPVIKEYQKRFKTDEPGAIECLLCDILLRLDTLGLDETDMLDQAITRRDRVRDHAPD